MTSTIIMLVAISLSGCEIKKASNTTPAPKTDAGVVKSESDSSKESATPKPTASTPKSSAAVSSEPTQTIGAEGSSTVYPICQAFAVEFEKKTRHTVSVGRQGTGGGYKKFLNRQADVWNASRPIAVAEVEELKQKGIGWIELSIAVDGIVIVVHAQNDWCSKLTCGQLKQMWEPDSKVTKWSELDPAWPAEGIQLFGADTDSGTFEYFTEVINGKKKATNTKYNPNSDDNVLVQEISKNKLALGYIPFGYYLENTEKLKAVLISPSKEVKDETTPFVEPTPETILSGEYKPLSRPLFMYVNLESLKRSEVKEFMRFVVSEEAQPLVETRMFVRVKEETRKQQVEKLEAAIAQLSAGKSE